MPVTPADVAKVLDQLEARLTSVMGDVAHLRAERDTAHLERDFLLGTMRTLVDDIGAGHCTPEAIGHALLLAVDAVEGRRR